MGECRDSKPGAGGTSNSQPTQTKVKPRLSRKLSPNSNGVRGSSDGAARSNVFSNPLPPRFEISTSAVPLPFDGSRGFRMYRSAENSTFPCAFRGANSMSAMERFGASLGSTAKYIFPVMRSYGPTFSTDTLQMQLGQSSS